VKVANGSDRVRCQLLGQFVVRHDGKPVDLGGATPRAVLVALLLRPEGFAIAGQLVSAVWGEPNGTTEDNLYHYVSRLRKQLKPLGLRIRSEPSGVRYRLVVPDAAVDVRQFERLVTAAAALAETEPEEALHRLRAALALWRGSAAFPELRRPGVRALAKALDSRRLDAEETLAGLEVQLGDPGRAVDRLRALVAEHPDRPGLAAALIGALHATGRTSEAAAAYREAEWAARRLGQPLPAQVRQAHREPAGSTGRHPGPAPAPAGWPVPPHELPVDTRHFVGREEELTRLVQPRADGPGGALVVVDGMAGVGKSALVVRAAYELAGQGRYPDGTLYVELRGFSGRTPTRPAAALHTLLSRLGVPGPQIPPELDARAALFRTVVARRRVLLVLDNARDEGQVRPLLPGTSSSLVLVTSRHRLAGLDDADHVTLETLPVPDAVRLFRSVVGPQRDHGDEQTVEQIVRLCGLLPLAVRIAAARLKTSRMLDGPHLLAQLQHTQDRLALLVDGERNLRSAFTVSFKHLPADERRVFAALSLHPGIDFEPNATAALLDTTPAKAQRLLDGLERANLLEHPARGRYQFHDLIREYATTAHNATRAERQTALARLYRFYEAAAAAAVDTAYPFEASQWPRTRCTTAQTGSGGSASLGSSAGLVGSAGRGGLVPDLADQAAAHTWLDVEQDNLLAAAHHAAAQGQPAHTLDQSATLHRHLRTRGHYVDAHTLHTRALELARAAGNRLSELAALASLGHICRLQGSYGPAITFLESAMRLARDSGDPAGEVDTLIGLGQVHFGRAAHGAAADCFERALGLARPAGNGLGMLTALNGLGGVHLIQGRTAPAADCYEQALGLARTAGNAPGEAEALTGMAYVNQHRGLHADAAAGFGQVLKLARGSGSRNGELNGLTGLGHVHLQLGRHGAAAQYYRQVLALARATGDRTFEVSGLLGLGHVHLRQGRHSAAADWYAQALDLARAVEEPNSQFDAHLGFGRASTAMGHPEQALRAHRSALELAGHLGQCPDEVRALDGLAHAYHALGDHNQARQLWQRALAILTDLGTTTTEDVTAADIQSCLAKIDAPSPPTG
jgi:tetratricopeptide (TPR) repeat protein